jgi:hypothetical protein
VTGRTRRNKTSFLIRRLQKSNPSLPPYLPTNLVNVLHHHTLCIINLGAELLQVIGRGVGVVELHHALEGGGEGLVHGKSDGLGREGGRERGREGGREWGREGGRGPYRVGCLAVGGHEAALNFFQKQKGEAAFVLGVVDHAQIDEGLGGGAGGGGVASAAVNDIMEDVLVVDDGHLLPAI